MIFLCAQPDEKYFFWQLQVQLHNFKRLGIDLSKVHQVFVSQREMSEEFKQYRASYPEVNIHWYPDTRKSKGYIPSMRPNGIKQFFAQFPEYTNEPIFYHDADIIFHKLPDFAKLCDGGTWYVSDTNSYLNADYIKSKGDGLLDEMCKIVGIRREVVESANKDSGGAQYILKGTDAAFWEKVENDCEVLYQYMNSSIPFWAEKWAKETGRPAGEYHAIQSWTSDMWVVLWNGLICNHSVKVSSELDFSWGTDSIQSYLAKPIFHNAGVTHNDRERIFYKGEYINISPFGVDFSYVDPTSASSMYVKEIMDTAREISQ